MRLRTYAALILFLSGIFLSPMTQAKAIPVEVKKTDQGWQLLRGGEPYLIRGAGGSHSLEQLAAAGANSVRTWAAKDIDDLLDTAHELGLSVTVGIWLGHERHGFDYGDPKQVAEQRQRVRETVLRYKDHPAVLLWGIGNEMEGFEEGNDPAIWTAVNDIAAMVKEIDPHHPTMVVTAEIGGGRIEAVHTKSHAIDIHGINSYGGAPSIAKRLNAGGGTKPYVVTEFGPPGSWEVPTTSWGAPIEMTSTQKADYYRKSYQRAVLDQPGMSLGSYAFVWGWKMEATATWFGMFLEDGSKLAAIDTMTELWSGKAPANLSPRITPLSVKGKDRVKPGAMVEVTSTVTEPENEPVTVRWVLRPESNEYVTGGDYRPNLPDIEGAIVDSRVDGARVRMPDEPGAYRLFLYAADETGHAATANVPLLVLGTPRPRMPVVVYDDGFEGMPWVPSGWMGNVDNLSLDGSHADDCHAGNTCIRMRYTGTFNWVGVVWQHPANNWGDAEGGHDVSGAAALEVWARGEYGGEKVSFGVGIIGEDKPYPDSGRTSKDDIVLTDTWTLYRVPLRRVDLSSIKSGFYVTLIGRRTPVTVYLDRIRFVKGE